MIIFGIVLELGFLFFYWMTGADRSNPLLISLFWLPFSIYFTTVIWILLKVKSTCKHFHWELIIIIGFSILYHMTFITSAQPLSDDIYRYAWDGKVLLNGINPYRFAPQNELLLGFRDAAWNSIQNKSIHTMYPPLAQLFFALTQLIHPSIYSLRILSILAHIGTSLVCFFWLRKAGHDPRKTIIFAWSPLCIIEFSNSGHIDSLAIFFMLCAFYFSYQASSQLQLKMNLIPVSLHQSQLGKVFTWENASALCLSFAVLVKVFPIFCLPFLLPNWTRRGKLMFFATLAIGSLPFLGAGKGLIHGSAYFTFFSTFNASTFALLWLSLQQFLNKAEALFYSRLLVYGFFILFWLTLFLNKQEEKFPGIQATLRKVILTYGLIFILTPTLHAWYLSWILPFLCFIPYSSWLLLTGLVFLSRSAYSTIESRAVWQDVGMIRLVEFIPFYLILFIEKLLGRPLFQSLTNQQSQ